MATVGKKRKINPHSTPTEIFIPTTINNRYDPLTENAPDENTIGKNNSNPNTSTKPQPNSLPPPIYFYGVTNYRAMLNNLQGVISGKISYKNPIKRHCKSKHTLH